jgi:hypothetical protein
MMRGGRDAADDLPQAPPEHEPRRDQPEARSDGVLKEISAEGTEGIGQVVTLKLPTAERLGRPEAEFYATYYFAPVREGLRARAGRRKANAAPDTQCQKKAPPERGASEGWDRECNGGERRQVPSCARRAGRSVTGITPSPGNNAGGSRGDARTTAPGIAPARVYSFSSTIALIGLLPEVASASENSTRTVSPS